uniref:Uncharacterized protein n=1 Tax=Schistocephalus solidus TaxID=70667 RepID=A0A0X3P713_SCHSO
MRFRKNTSVSKVRKGDQKSVSPRLMKKSSKLIFDTDLSNLVLYTDIWQGFSQIIRELTISVSSLKVKGEIYRMLLLFYKWTRQTCEKMLTTLIFLRQNCAKQKT